MPPLRRREVPVPGEEQDPSPGIVEHPPTPRKKSGGLHRCWCGKSGSNVCHPIPEAEIDS